MKFSYFFFACSIALAAVFAYATAINHVTPIQFSGAAFSVFFLLVAYRLNRVGL